MTLLKNIGTTIIMIALLGGCSAVITSYVTTPIWLIIVLFFPFVPALRPLWSFWTLLMLVQFILVALLGLVVFFSPGSGSNGLQPSAAWLLLPLAIILTWVSWRIGRDETSSRERRLQGMALQIVIIGAEVIFAFTAFGRRP